MGDFEYEFLLREKVAGDSEKLERWREYRERHWVSYPLAKSQLKMLKDFLRKDGERGQEERV